MPNTLEIRIEELENDLIHLMNDVEKLLIAVEELQERLRKGRRML